MIGNLYSLGNSSDITMPFVSFEQGSDKTTPIHYSCCKCYTITSAFIVEIPNVWHNLKKKVYLGLRQIHKGIFG